MKKSFTLLLAFCGAIAFLLPPGIVAAFDSGYGNMVIIHNSGGGQGPEWGARVPIDDHGDSRVFNYWQGDARSYTGIAITWLGDASTLPSGVSFNTPFNGASAVGSLSSFLNPGGQFGPQINDLIMIQGGVSFIDLVSEPAENFYPFSTADLSGSGGAPSPPYEPVVNQYFMWSTATALWSNYNAVIVPTQMNTISGQPGTYTPYTPQNASWPGWDPTVADPSAFSLYGPPGATYYPWPNCPTGYCAPGKDGQPVDYINPALWTQWTFEIQNDIPTVPEPGALLLLGFGLMAVVGMRRVVKA